MAPGSPYTNHLHFGLLTKHEAATKAEKIPMPKVDFKGVLKAMKEVQKAFGEIGVSVEEFAKAAEAYGRRLAKPAPPCPRCGYTAWRHNEKKMVSTCQWCEVEVSDEFLRHYEHSMKQGAPPLPRRRMEVPVRGVQKMGVYMEDLEVGDLVVLVPEPDNPVDEHAVKVMTPANQVLGYLPKDLAWRLDAEEWNAEICSVLHYDGKASGIRLMLYPDKPEARLTGKLL